MHEYIDFLQKLIFLIEDPVGYAINLTIVSLFLLGLCNIGLSLLRLGRERLAVRRARVALRAPDAQCPTQPEKVVLEFLHVSRRSLVGRRIARIVRLRAAGLGQRDVLQQLTMERLDGYGALARYIGTILTLFGLLGTVFGLSLAIFKAQEALGASYDLVALKSLAQALGGTLGGMKTAFVTTLAGILTALPLSFLNHLVRRMQSRVLTQLEDFVVYEFLPALERAEPGANEAARTFAHALISAAGDLNQVREAVTAAATDYKASSNVLVSIVDTLHQAVQSFSNSTAQLVGNQETFTQTIRDTRDAVRSMADAITQQAADLRTFIANSNKALEDRLTAIEANSEATRLLQENLQTLAENFQQAVVGYHTQFKEVLGEMFHEVKTSINTLLTDVSQHYREDIADHVRSIQQAFENTLSQHMQSVQGLLEQHQQSMSNLLGNQGTALRAFSDMALDLHSNTSILLEKLATEDKRDMEVLSETLKDVLDKMFADFQTSLTALLTDTHQQYKDGTGTYQKAFESALARQMGDFQKIIEQNRQSLVDLFGGQKTALMAFSDMIVDVQNNVDTLFEQFRTTGNGRVSAKS